MFLEVKMPRVIVIQTAGIAASICQSIADELGLTNQQVVVFSYVDEWIESEYIEPGKVQLLITGTHYGDMERADRYVRRMKARNPKLKVWLLSLMGPGDSRLYERSICDVPDRYRYTMGEVKKFLDKNPVAKSKKK